MWKTIHRVIHNVIHNLCISTNRKVIHLSITATTGKGELFVTGNVTNTASITQSTISITGSLESNVNDIKATEQILNDGALIFTGIGTNTNIIDGFGDLIIEGNIENAPGKTIDQNLINVTAGNSFTTDATDITTTGNGILNDGSLTFTGGTNTSTITAL